MNQEQQQLDPTKPAEAALILYTVARQTAGNADYHDALAKAYQTLLTAVTPKEIDATSNNHAQPTESKFVPN